MISLILPYWDRQEIADEAFEFLAKQYADLDLEVVVVDDGNKVPFKLPKTPLKVKIVTLPLKDEPTSPLHAWNMGVKAASGKIIALSCIEILHETPVLAQMRGQLEQLGKKGYVLASAWCPEQKIWHCHSTVSVPECPEGTGIGFMSMLHKKWFEKVGGFDEEYMGGAGYEDRDFIYRLYMAGTRFFIRDDLVVTHPKRKATIHWKPEGFIRNEALFRKKWITNVDYKRHVTFLCLKAGNAYGPEYVNILNDMVRRNLSHGYPGRFVCLTDDPEGLDENIQTIPLPDDLETWWGKLYMFKHGLFAEGERIIFMDLDTVITGDLGPLASYDGQFATLRDFLFPQQVGPAIISWRVNDFSASIWDEWEACGRPKNEGGDLWWINNLEQGKFIKNIDILQDKLPGFFCSFKKDCNPYPPKGAHVVCFHGQPKPDNCKSDWVKETWRVGGLNMADFEVICNTGREVVGNNIASACKRHLPWLETEEIKTGDVAIVGGGPSLDRYIHELEGKYIVAVNGSHDYLLSKGIIPDVHLLIDARPENIEFMGTPARSYWIASQCFPEIFDRAGKNTTVVHMNTDGVLESIPQTTKNITLISSGSTVGLAGMAIAYCKGWRKIYVYGMDSSYEDDHHAYKQARNDDDKTILAVAGGKQFVCTPWMVAQVQHFQKLTNELAEGGCEIHVRCDGLLGHVAWITSLNR